MNFKCLLIVLSIIFLSSSCFSSPSDKEKERERKLTELMESHSGQNKNNQLPNTDGITEFTNEVDKNSGIDYSTIEISKDSIDIALYDLIAYSNKMSDENLINNIEILIGKGANPNSIITIHTSARKAGTYIPIIKHFYKNKYRSYTYTSTAFHAAVAKGSIIIIQKLIDLGGVAHEKRPI